MFKKLIYILIIIVICCNSCLAQTQEGYIEYNGYQYKFKPGDEAKFLKNANVNMVKFEQAKTIPDKVFYMQEALRYYFLLEKINSKNVEAQIGLGRVYNEIKKDSYAKKHFFNALNMDRQNPKTNYYFANFYYSRNDFINALYYYKQAYACGYSKSYELNYRLATTYEKLADIETAKNFYKMAYRLKPSNANLIDKIRLLDELNYSNSQYYLFRK